MTVRMPTAAETKQVLREARTILEKKWAQGAFAQHDPDDPTVPKMCLVGALCWAAGGVKKAGETSDGTVLWDLTPDYDEYYYGQPDLTELEEDLKSDTLDADTAQATVLVQAAAHRVLACINNTFDTEYDEIPMFNDDEDTTLDQVLSVVDCAIAATNG